MPVVTTLEQTAPPVVGVLGGGQLGRMMAPAAHRLGLDVRVLDPLGALSPAGQLGLAAVQGAFTAERDIAALAAQCDVLTVEIEHVNAAFLQQLQEEGAVRAVHPAPATIALIQDKLKQKQFFATVDGVDVAPFRAVASLDDAKRTGETFGFPFMLKARRFAYDGRGNAVVSSPEDLPAALAKLGAAEFAGNEDKLYAEKWVPFAKELAVMVVKGRTADGGDDVRAYPVVETTQRDSICDTVLAPARVQPDVAERAAAMAMAAVAPLEGCGIYGVELFVTADGRVLLNEVAPRPHNSGHYTIEACETDQFEQHLRAIAGLPLGSTALRVPAALMVNVLGAPSGRDDDAYALLRRSLEVPGALAHYYGKAEARAGRKLGHFTITAPSYAELVARAAAISPEIVANAKLEQQAAPPVVGIVMGSDSDLPTMAAAAQVLERFGVPYELTIVSAHRTPGRMYEYAQSAVARGLQVIIAGAGGAAHLPGMIAALTPLPVVGVPVKTSTLNGEDSLLSIVQMPRGVPVATVAIGNATNAGLLAVRMLGGAYTTAMAAFLDEQKREVDGKIDSMDQRGWKAYLADMKQ